MSKKQRLYLLRVEEQCLPPEAKAYAYQPCRNATNIIVRNDDFQPCIALGQLPSCDSSLAIWAASTNFLPIHLLMENLCGKFPDATCALFIHALDTEISRRVRDGLLLVKPQHGQYLVTDLTIKDVDQYIDQQYQEFQQRHQEEEEGKDLEALSEAEEELNGYLDAWELHQAEDDVDEDLEEEWRGEWNQDFEGEPEDQDEVEPQPTRTSSSGLTRVSNLNVKVGVELIQMKRFGLSLHLHGEPARLAKARDQLNRLLERFQRSPSDFSPHDVTLLKQLMQMRVFHPRKGHCFKCKRHLYDHLDKTCLNCWKYQIVCSNPSCGACGCAHDPNFARK